MFTFVLVVYIARYLGVVVYGRYSTALMFATMFLFFADLGLSVLTIREVSRNIEEAGKYIGNVTVIKLALALLTWGFVAALSNFMWFPEDTKYAVYLLMAALIINTFIETFCAIFRAYEQMGYEAFVKIFQKAACMVFGIIALVAGFGFKGVVNAYLGANVVSGIICLIILHKKFVKFRFLFDFDFCRKIIRSALPVGISIFFSVIYLRGAATLFLSKMKGDAVVGWYSAAFKPIEVLMVISMGFTGALFPVFSKLYKNSRESLLFTCEKAIKVLMAIIIPIAVGTTILADELICAVYGSSFKNSAGALQILVWAGVLIFVNSVLTQLLIAINKQRFNAIFTFLCVVFNVGMNLILIPRLSYIGSSITAVGTELLLFVLCFLVISRVLGLIPLHKIIIKPVIAGVAMGLSIFVIRGMPLFIIIPAGMVVYFIFLKLLKILDKDDYEILKSLFRR